MFTIFIDNLEEEAELEGLNTFIVKFENNTTAIQEIVSDEDRTRKQTALSLLGKWAAKWGMMFNVRAR
jgi:hypothetical protein